MEKKYWLSIEDRNNDSEFLEQQNKEFSTDPIQSGLEDNFSSNRRDFLKYLGFGIGASAIVTACTQTPVKYALPYVNKPVEITPGQANYYASTFFDGLEYNSILVKTREGRPIKIEVNPSSPITPKGISARAQAVVLGVYDSHRYKGPALNKPSEEGGDITYINWDVADKAVIAKLNDANAKKAGIRLLTSTQLSPSARKLISELGKKYDNFQHVTLDAISSSGILEANELSFGKRVVPAYRFDIADVIVSFGADFLGTWISPTEFTAQFSSRRKIEEGKPLNHSRLIQFESHLSLTGSNSDTRIPIKPSQEAGLILSLYNKIAEVLGKDKLNSNTEIQAPGDYITVAAKELLAARGKSLVVSGSNDKDVQVIVNGINVMLENYGNTIDIVNHSNLRQGIDSTFTNLVNEMAGGKVDILLIHDCNPAYTTPDSKAFNSALKAVRFKVSFASSPNETSVLCDYILPDRHLMESWNDFEPYIGHYSLSQPTIDLVTVFNTRQFADSLLKFLGDNRKYYDYIRDTWRNEILVKVDSFDLAWNQALHDGVFGLKGENSTFQRQYTNSEKQPKFIANLAESATKVSSTTSQGGEKLELVLYQKVGIGDGTMAGNPWLQELPDPISKATWDNYVCLPAKLQEKLNVNEGDLVEVKSGKYSTILPVLIQPGQQAQTISIALGYGRTVVSKAGLEVGQSVWPFAEFKSGNIQFFTEVTITPGKGKVEFAKTQTQGTLAGRPIALDTTVQDFGTFVKKHKEERQKMRSHLINIYPGHDYDNGHRWVMAIDLNACTGCGACVIACQVENNISVVGKDEIRRGREMHWIRIDRYYSDSTIENKSDSRENKENPAEYPEVIFQPMLCQHCEDAPCENVCPVLATVHSSEGLNQQAYNRCFGTRYCANNCPYKVRRFNWLDYANQDTEILGIVDSEKRFKYNPVDGLNRMVLNPDVTVRARGVMEKCSFCVQRLQSVKLEAKKEGRRPAPNEFHTACSQSCPAGAITFGDFNDKESDVAKIFNADRSFMAIEELKTKPSISYLMKVRNKPQNTKLSQS